MDAATDPDAASSQFLRPQMDRQCSTIAIRPFSLKDHMVKDEVKIGRVTTEVFSKEGHPKILRYDMKQLVRYTALGTLFSNGTVFTMDKTALINVLIMVALTVLVSAITICMNLHDLDSLKELKLQPLQQLTTQMNQFVPFCLAYYVALSLNRWWALRVTALGKVFDSFANVSMLVSCELSDKKWLDVRNQVAKYGLASVELLVQAARRQDDLDYLMDRDILSQAEVEAVARKTYPYQRPMMMWAWIMRICVGSLDHNKSPPPVAAQVIKHCLFAREGMAVINAHLDTQLPFAYVHLITFLVNVQNFVFAVLSGVTIAVDFAKSNVTAMVQQLVSCLLVVLIYQALLQITYVVLDPFGDDVLDFPIKAYTTYIATMVDAFFEAQQPCPVVAEDGTLKRPRRDKIEKKKKQDLGKDRKLLTASSPSPR
eukprot:CAMPEP_0172725786 /NCGR_PEP_ID=MMETSP1074-20121228/89289_1 /TAXON_ID=2916 /ORGANISM="Ceratium fusus, Strain PA161109" /LENGTH=426 /DNA_ID=CAMNT_0013552645 /DNA_START=74 /DNA_END=1354 /DNA_ORIENTATION=+